MSVTIQNPEGKASGFTRIYVDGKDWDGAFIDKKVFEKEKTDIVYVL